MNGSRRAFRRASTAGAAVACAAAMVGLATTAAQAAGSATHSNYYSHSELKNTPHVGSGLVIANLYNDTSVTMLCYTDTENVTSRSYSNYNSPRWFEVRTAGGTVGYVQSSHVYNQVGVGHC